MVAEHAHTGNLAAGACGGGHRYERQMLLWDDFAGAQIAGGRIFSQSDGGCRLGKIHHAAAANRHHKVKMLTPDYLGAGITLLNIWIW